MISIIVPVYNSEKDLENCILSLTNQTICDIEIILVDDGSADKSGEICDRAAQNDNRIKVIHTENSGVSAARNTGLAAARGEYAVFCDSDDTLDKDYCRIMLENAGEDGTVVICGYKDLRTEFVCRLSDNPTDKVPIKDFLRVYNKELINAPVNKLFSFKIINENNIRFDTSLDLGEDLIFNLDYISHCNSMTIINRGLYNYNTHEDHSLSSKYRNDMYEIQMYLMRRLTDFVNSVGAYDADEYCCMYLKILNKIMLNNIHIGSGMTHYRVIRENNRILREDKYLKNLDPNSLKNVGHGYLNAYKSGNYRIIQAYLSLARYKKKIKRFIKR